ncbi:MAG TPA: hypothetical protein VM422_13615 [Amaricoccus sp.]|nr:hypothetical protein [Amaricoccus sp.]
MGDAGQIATWALAFRVGERIVLSLVVVLVALVVTAGFWRSIQKVDFRFGKDQISGAANVVLATPVFALLALIGFAWVSFSNPIAVTVPAAAAGGQTASTGEVKFVGAVPGAPPAGSDVAFERQKAEGLVMSLNCVARAAGDKVSPRDADALVVARLTALQPVWAADWGDFAAFRDWALGRSAAAPDPEARAVLEALQPAC